jgi:hypothetical protein
MYLTLERVDTLLKLCNNSITPHKIGSATLQRRLVVFDLLNYIEQLSELLSNHSIAYAHDVRHNPTISLWILALHNSNKLGQ